MVKGKCHIEVIDSQSVAMGLGLIVILAARKAKAGATLNELTDWVRKAMSRSHLLSIWILSSISPKGTYR